jgi:hypothetical protein
MKKNIIFICVFRVLDIAEKLKALHIRDQRGPKSLKGHAWSDPLSQTLTGMLFNSIEDCISNRPESSVHIFLNLILLQILSPTIQFFYLIGRKKL